jgi:hypothetical protein
MTMDTAANQLHRLLPAGYDFNLRREFASNGRAMQEIFTLTVERRSWSRDWFICERVGGLKQAVHQAIECCEKDYSARWKTIDPKEAVWSIPF